LRTFGEPLIWKVTSHLKKLGIQHTFARGPVGGEAFVAKVEDTLGFVVPGQLRRTGSPCSTGAGNAFCIDRGSKGHPIVYHRHDWYKGSMAENGHRAADNLYSFLTKWAGVSFAEPKNGHWPSTFTEEGVSWSREHFDARLVL
jgi:hypothetical protein